METYKYPLRNKLLNIQTDLKAPKGQVNSFGNYRYRSCEDILEAVKPLLKANKCTLTISDEVTQIGERYYIKATATLKDAESDAEIVNTAFAREEDAKRGMDASQITGTASSYARKYALNGLFCIDDTKDADTDEHSRTRLPVRRYPRRCPAAHRSERGRSRSALRGDTEPEVLLHRQGQPAAGRARRACRQAAPPPHLRDGA